MDLALLGQAAGAGDGAPVNWADTYGWTALYFAGVSGHIAVVRYLGKALNEDVNLADNNGVTP